MRRTGRRVRAEHLDVRLVADAPGGRVGIVVPRHKHSAVDRNRLKRRLRELVRTRLLPGLSAGHLVIRARPEAYDDAFEALERKIERVAREVARLMNQSGEAGA